MVPSSVDKRPSLSNGPFKDDFSDQHKIQLYLLFFHFQASFSSFLNFLAERERERERGRVCVCVREREREVESECVCVRERGGEREKALMQRRDLKSGDC